jgi:hypothetical protein
MKAFLVAIKIFYVGFLVAGLILSIVAGMETVAFLYLWWIIASQALSVVNGVAVFWGDYHCNLTNKVAFAAFAIVSAAIYIRICFYLLDLLKAEVYEGWPIFIAAFILALFDTGLSLTAKRFLLKVPFPFFDQSPSDEK